MIKLMYAYVGELPQIFEYTLKIVRHFFDGEIILITPKNNPLDELIKKNINKIFYYGVETNFYNEYKIKAIKHYADDNTVYLDPDIIPLKSRFFDKITEKQNFFAFLNCHFRLTEVALPDIPYKLPSYLYNGGIIKLQKEIREKYCQKSLELFDWILKYKDCQEIESVAEESCAASFPEIMPLAEVGYNKDFDFIHVYRPKRDDDMMTSIKKLEELICLQ